MATSMLCCICQHAEKQNFKDTCTNIQTCHFQESFAKRCFSLIDEYAPGFCSSIIGYDMLTPPDLEKEFGLTGKISLNGFTFNSTCARN